MILCIYAFVTGGFLQHLSRADITKGFNIIAKLQQNTCDKTGEIFKKNEPYMRL